MMRNVLSGLVFVLLALGLLPSLAGISKILAQEFPGSSSYLGPLNPLKLGFPFFVAQLYVNRHFFTAKYWWWALAGVSALWLSTFLSGFFCYFPPALMRESAVIFLGFIAASSLLTLSTRLQKSLLITWSVILFLGCFLDVFLPRVIDWLYLFLLDDQTRVYDSYEIGARVLAGFWGRQSLAKLLVWIPSLILFFVYSHPFSKPVRLFWVGFGALATALTLATTQRGPFLAALAGWLVYFWKVVQATPAPQRKRIGLGGLIFFAGVGVLTVAVVPKDILEARLRSLVGLAPKTYYGQVADLNKGFRLTIAGFSLETIAKNPLGNACVAQSEYEKWRILPTHTHNLFFQQFLDRGWLWGMIHLLIWGSAWLGAWRSRERSGWILASALTSAIVMGFFDHPWFVLNHSVILWTLILFGLRSRADGRPLEEMQWTQKNLS